MKTSLLSSNSRLHVEVGSLLKGSFNQPSATCLQYLKPLLTPSLHCIVRTVLTEVPYCLLSSSELVMTLLLDLHILILLMNRNDITSTLYIGTADIV